MLFQVYGEDSIYQWFGLFIVLSSLIAINEVIRRSKKGAIIVLLIIPFILTIYFSLIYISAAFGADWVVNNPTYTNMNSWFHYAKLYASLAGCIGFMLIRYNWSLGKKKWFLFFPYAILAINILIAVFSDFESAIRGWNTWWTSSEGVKLYGGYHNILNGLAGLLNIIGITGWLGIYVSKDKRDMLWPDMIWLYILAYDIWNFAYTYNCLPTHSWYCGVALLLAPTIATFFWNKGAWLQSRAHTLAVWCMFAQVFPLFQDQGKFAVKSVQYSNNFLPITIISILSFIANIVLVSVVIYKSIKLKRNPYTNEIFTDSNDYKQAINRANISIKNL